MQLTRNETIIIAVMLVMLLTQFSNAQSFQCSATVMCPNNLCCGKEGWCTSTAESCLRTTGCQSQCRDIPRSSTVCNATTPAVAGLTTNVNVSVSDMGAVEVLTTSRVSKSKMLKPIVSLMDSENCTFRYELQLCELVAMMGGPEACPYCLYYYEYIKEATQLFNLDCPIRIASFLSQIRHETQGLQQLWQPADNGAGAIHIVPGNFHLAIKGVPKLTDDFVQEFPDLSIDLPNISTNRNQQINVAAFLMRPEHAFLTAGWWYIYGSSAVLGINGCTDLRTAADQGLGAPITAVAPTMVNGVPKTILSGMYEVSRCIFGDAPDSGLAQRLQYYILAKSVTDSFQEQGDLDEEDDGQHGVKGDRGLNSNLGGNAEGLFGPNTPTVTIILGCVGGLFGVLLLVSTYQRHKRQVRRVGARVSTVWAQYGQGDDPEDCSDDASESGTKEEKGSETTLENSNVQEIEEITLTKGKGKNRPKHLSLTLPTHMVMNADERVSQTATVTLAPTAMAMARRSMLYASTSTLPDNLALHQQQQRYFSNSVNTPGTPLAISDEYGYEYPLPSPVMASYSATQDYQYPQLQPSMYFQSQYSVYNPRASMYVDVSSTTTNMTAPGVPTSSAAAKWSVVAPPLSSPLSPYDSAFYRAQSS